VTKQRFSKDQARMLNRGHAIYVDERGEPK
jgi:hypothetical protein